MVSAVGVALNCNYEKYLGLPTIVGRSKYQAYRSIKERIWAKISSWKNTFLSQAGKKVMLKVVIQGIPTFTMSVFMLPKKLLKEINSMMGKF